MDASEDFLAELFDLAVPQPKYRAMLEPAGSTPRTMRS